MPGQGAPRSPARARRSALHAEKRLGLVFDLGKRAKRVQAALIERDEAMRAAHRAGLRPGTIARATELAPQDVTKILRRR